jgi:N-methylhydantoinase B
MRALGKAETGLCIGEPFSTSANLTLHGWDRRGSEYIMYFFAGGGYGGHSEGDGLSNGCSTVSMARTSPVEIMEERYPIRFEYYRLREGSGGLGRHRGGLGVEYELSLESAGATLSFLMDRGKFAPRGVLGGSDAAMTSIEVRRTDGELYVPEHKSKDQDIALRKGDRVVVRTPGGGGYGLPEERAPDLVARDLRANYGGAL